VSFPRSIWQDVIDWLQSKDSQLPAIFPSELPSETSPDFWFVVAKLEMSTRDMLSAKIRLLVTNKEPPNMTILEAWLYRRRVEWAGQLVLAGVQKGEPQMSLPQLLEWLLISSWETDGCIGLWNHAERGGTPHPENPDGLTPILKKIAFI
jgi:hypothetical protein